MKVVGIDPGTAACGYGIVHQDGGRLRAITHGWWRTSPDEPVALRLKTIFDGVASLIEAHEPEAVVLEESFVGADAQTVGQSVATPIEQQLNGVDNMNYMYSVNATGNSQMRLIVDFGVGTDPNTDLVLTQIRETQAAPQLPIDVTRFGVSIQKSLTAPMMLVALDSPHGTYDAKFLANYAFINLADPISRLKGIGSIQVFGSGRYAMRVWLNPDRMAKLGITVSDVAGALRPGRPGLGPGADVGLRRGDGGGTRRSSCGRAGRARRGT